MTTIDNKKTRMRLQQELKKSIKQLEALKEEDPFADPDRVVDNAAPDTEAKEEAGHDRIKALQLQLEQKIARLKKAIKRLDEGVYGICVLCGKSIDSKRLKAMPSATLCISCEREKEGVKG